MLSSNKGAVVFTLDAGVQIGEMFRTRSAFYLIYFTSVSRHTLPCASDNTVLFHQRDKRMLHMLSNYQCMPAILHRQSCSGLDIQMVMRDGLSVSLVQSHAGDGTRLSVIH